MIPDSRRTRRRLALIWLACLAVAFFCVAYPLYVISPFRAQGPKELAFALVVTRFRPVLTVLCAIAALAALVGYWRAQPRILWRLLAVVGTGLVVFLAVLARVNVYEALMFHHLDHPEFAAVGQAKLDNDEKVIVVKVGDVARAYPIRSMSYHHVVNDVLGGAAIAATY